MIELLVVIAVIAILAAVLLPALNKSKAKAQGVMCMSNLRQLSLAWTQYAHDSRDHLPYAVGGRLNPQTAPYIWVTGFIDTDTNNPSNWDVEVDLKKSPLWPYCGAAIWRCPGDPSTIVPSVGPLRGQRVPRVRSMAMLFWVGGNGGGNSPTDGPGGPDPVWRIYRTLPDIQDPGPARTLLFGDQRGIFWNSFLVDMTGFPDHPELTTWGDWARPANYHNGAASFSFVDGHAETKRWRDPRTTQYLPDPIPQLIQPGNPDIMWMQERATRKIR